MRKILITTSIPYVNAQPHIGFALELALADVEARKNRQSQNNTFFLTGADENGLKNYTIARKQGISPQELVDKNSALFKNLTQKLNISNDNFIRTSSPTHHKIAQAFWKELEKSGDIYKKKYQALYCVGCETFVLPRDLKDGKCPFHNQKPQRVEEENYFFRLSKYKDKIYQVIKNNRVKVTPQSRKNELLNLIKDAQDVSFSRPSSKLPWGVRVPQEQKSAIRNPQTIYVWGDALVNYISGLPGKSFKEKIGAWNGKDKIIHFIGKDILRFHGSIWIGMLLSVGLKLPDEIRVHGFISSNGQKMSKTLGNVVDPFEYIEKYSADAVRFYLLNEIPAFSDGDFSAKKFIEVYNSHLANELGNLVQRAIVLLGKFKTKNGKARIRAKSSRLNSLEEIWQEIRRLNEFISQEKLWEKGKEKELEKLGAEIYQIAIAMEPYLPETSRKILGQLKTLKPKPLFPRTAMLDD